MSHALAVPTEDAPIRMHVSKKVTGNAVTNVTQIYVRRLVTEEAEGCVGHSAVPRVENVAVARVVPLHKGLNAGGRHSVSKFNQQGELVGQLAFLNTPTEFTNELHNVLAKDSVHFCVKIMFFYALFVRTVSIHVFLQGRKHFRRHIAQRLIVWPILRSERVVSCVPREGRLESESVLFFIILILVLNFFYRYN